MDPACHFLPHLFDMQIQNNWIPSYGRSHTCNTQKYHYIINFQKNRRILTYCKYFLQLVNPGRNTSSNLLPSQLSLLKGKQSCCIDIHMYMITRNIACFPQNKYIFYFCIISPGPYGNKPQ